MWSRFPALDLHAASLPAHLPVPALAVIAAVRSLAPKLPAIGVFDTAYYADLPPAAFEYAVPARWRREFGIRRYGFHGMAHRSLCQSARTMLPATEARRELNEQSGLLGLSGKTGDMRALLALEADGDAAAALLRS